MLSSLLSSGYTIFMKPIYLAADHAGFALKEAIKGLLKKNNIPTSDATPAFIEGDDYPLVAKTFGKAIPKGGRGILICGSGVGACIAANRQKGLRAAVGHTVEEVELAREHNDINVLCLSGWNTKPASALKLIRTFLDTPTSKATRHKRRVKQLS